MRSGRVPSAQAARRRGLGCRTPWISLAALAALLMVLMLGCAGCEVAPTADTPGAPSPPQVIFFDQVGLESFRVIWYPHTNTGGRSLTGFGILVYQSTTGWDESRTIWIDGGSRYRYSVTDLEPWTRYWVKIKSCNGSDGRSSCSVWSKAGGTVTTGVEH